MEKKSQDFSINEAQRLAKTPAGQKLMAMLQQQDSGQLKKAMDAAASGKYQEAGSLLSSLLSSPEAKELIRQLGGKNGRF